MWIMTVSKCPTGFICERIAFLLECLDRDEFRNKAHLATKGEFSVHDKDGNGCVDVVEAHEALFEMLNFIDGMKNIYSSKLFF